MIKRHSASMRIFNYFLLQISLTLWMLLSTAYSQPLGTSQDSIELSAKAFGLKYQKAGEEFIGSGCLIKKDASFYLLTADHNTSGMDLESLWLYIELNGRAKTIPTKFVIDSSTKVITSKGYDLSLLRVKPFNEPCRILFDSVSIDYRDISWTNGMSNKGQQVFAGGYVDYRLEVLILKMTPLRFYSSIETGLQRFPRADNGEETTLFFLAADAPKGMSGGIRPDKRHRWFLL